MCCGGARALHEHGRRLAGAPRADGAPLGVDRDGVAVHDAGLGMGVEDRDLQLIRSGSAMSSSPSRAISSPRACSTIEL